MLFRSCLKIRWNRFYGDIVLGWFSIGTIACMGFMSRIVYPVHSWGSLLITGFVMGPLSLIINFFIILGKKEREMVVQMVLSKVKGAGN